MMWRERYIVSVTFGWRGDEKPANRYLGHKRTKTIPCTAKVLDSAYGFAVVKQYRSDEGGWNYRSGPRLNEAALAMAEEEAARLNGDCD